METSEKQKEEMKLLFSQFQKLTLDTFLKPGVLQILYILSEADNKSLYSWTFTTNWKLFG